MEVEKINVRITNRKRGPMEETDLDVLVEVTVPAELSDPGVDIVTVLDVSPSRWGHDKKLEHLKIAMESLIKKLRPNDRMSVITFSMHPQKLCPLNLMTAEVQAQVELLLKNLAHVPGGGESMTLQELNNNHSEGRMPVIFLVSDSTDGDASKDAAQIPPCDVRVHKFFFCRWPRFFAKKTFSYLQDSGELELRISRVLADVCTPVKDVSLNLSPVKVQIDGIEITTAIAKVINLGRDPLYCRGLGDVGKIVRIIHNSRDVEYEVLVTLHLPAVDEEVAMEVLEVAYSCRYGGEPYGAPPMMIAVTRTGQDVEKESDEVVRAQQRPRYVIYGAPPMMIAVTRTAIDATLTGGNITRHISDGIVEATQSFNAVKGSLKTLNDIPHGSCTRIGSNQRGRTIQLGGTTPQSSNSETTSNSPKG